MCLFNMNLGSWVINGSQGIVRVAGKVRVSDFGNNLWSWNRKIYTPSK